MPGTVAGLLGCLFGIIGIFAFAIVFVPLAACCALVGLVRGIVGKSAAGIGTSVLAGALSVFGFIASPTLWILTAGVLAGGLIASQPPTQPSQVAQRTAMPPTYHAAPAYPALPPTHYPPSPPPPLMVSPALRQPTPANQMTAGSVGVTAPFGSAAAIQQAKAESQRARQECRNRRLAGELKTFKASTECSNPVTIAAYSRAGYPFMDLVVAVNARLLALSEAIDQHRMTEAEANAEYNEFLTRIRTTELERLRR